MKEKAKGLYQFPREIQKNRKERTKGINLNKKLRRTRRKQTKKEGRLNTKKKKEEEEEKILILITLLPLTLVTIYAYTRIPY